MKIEETLKEIRENNPHIIITINNEETNSHIRIYGRTDKEDGHNIITQFAMDWLEAEHLPF